MRSIPSSNVVPIENAAPTSAPRIFRARFFVVDQLALRSGADQKIVRHSGETRPDRAFGGASAEANRVALRALALRAAA